MDAAAVAFGLSVFFSTNNGVEIISGLRVSMALWGMDGSCKQKCKVPKHLAMESFEETLKAII